MAAASIGAGAASATESLGETASYHGQPILKAPVWSREVPTYLFVGGLAGASATLAYAAELRGADELSRRAWLAASAGITVCPPLLIIDLGRPERFLNMFRMFKITSPMSIGSWTLGLSGATTTLAGFNVLSGRLARPARIARPVAGVFGLLLSTYTAALFADTAVPAWHEARHELPFVFGAGAALSAAGAVTAATPVRHAAPARRLALGAAVAELAATGVMEHRLGLHAETYEQGRARTLKWVSRACVAAGAAVLATAGARNRPAAVAGGCWPVPARWPPGGVCSRPAEPRPPTPATWSGPSASASPRGPGWGVSRPASAPGNHL